MNDNWCYHCTAIFESPWDLVTHQVATHDATMPAPTGPTQAEVDGAIASIMTALG